MNAVGAVAEALYNEIHDRVAATALTMPIRILLLGAALLGFGAAAVPAPAKRLVIISWDAGADWIIDRLLGDGKLPNVARMVEKGVHAEYVTPAFPSKTAPGHAAIWTGAYSDVNGISGNLVPVLPRADHTLLEQRDGFDSTVLTAEPIWLTALLGGKRVAALNGTHAAPSEPYLKAMQAGGIPADRFIGIDAFRNPISAATVITADELRPAENWNGLRAAKGRSREWSVRIGNRVFYILVLDSPDDRTDGFDSVLVCPDQKVQNSACATLKPVEAGSTTTNWGGAFRVSKDDVFGYARFRLFSLGLDGASMILYQRAVNGFRGSIPKEIAEDYIRAAGGFTDLGFGPYQQGALGPPIWLGGDGTAERRLLEIIRLNIEFLDSGTRYVLKRTNADLIINYSSASDSAGHTWMGVLDPESPTYNAAIAAKLWPFYSEVFELQDAWLGNTIDAAGANTAVSLVSDHGMTGVGKNFYPNAVLERAGLLTQTADRKIDLAKTRICAPPWGDYFLSVNSMDWKGGIVTRAEREEVLRKATEALLSAIDPETGKHILTRVFRPEEIVGMGMGGPAGGDLYLDLADGYVPSAAVTSDLVRKIASPIGSGVHGFYPHRTKMQAIWYAMGPGLNAGKRVGGIQQIDIAPTLSRLLGIPIPRNATGHVIGEALAGSN